MANTTAILGIIGAVLAALTAIILVGTAVAIPAVFAIGAGIYILVQKPDNKLVMASGAIAIIAGLLSFLGAMNGVSIGGFTADFSVFSGGIASALAILGCIEIAAVSLKTGWESLPQAGAIAVAVLAAAAVLIGFIMNVDLANQGSWAAYVVGVGSLSLLYPTIVAMQE